MPEPPDPTQLSTSFVHLIQRFTGNQPDALAQLRQQIEAERDHGQQVVERAVAQLLALEQLESLIDQGEVAEPVRTSAPPLKKAILTILDEHPGHLWFRDTLFTELLRRGWGPGGTNPRNTYTSRLRDLEKENKLRRVGRDGFTSLKEVEPD